ncbi:MAG: phytanoyl-CoA dioxygenase family protein [Candidatus Latescibacteria bacterium]|nr:phytanoyl-CoA dioxygenase family protein [Candidatus Latescibacterota bacterium]MBT5830692.1 phytanoyl-CoA dioxygenase family protein [Candidatus Latescibacterota bacterium]
MTAWVPTEEQQKQWDANGYFVLKNVVSKDIAFEMRGVIKNEVLKPEPDGRPDADPMDPMGDSIEAKAARFRKLGNFCVQSPLIWHTFQAGEEMLSVARHFLGDDVIVKFNSVFIKPAKTGTATPWHQDNGLWRDGETEPFNAWMALDPATQENGCMQFIPGSHKTEIVPHVMYEDSIHGELPRERVTDMIGQMGVDHQELEPGDVVCWHSSLWHYSPPNPSPNSRIAIAGVWTNSEINEGRIRAMHRWAMKNGEVCTAFPPEAVDIEDGVVHKPEAFTKAVT